MLLALAPMEGLTDAPMRDVLTRAGQFDWCVTEFIRITDRLLPDRVFHGVCPELLQGGRTAAGTPVHVQLLGSDAAVLAANAARLAALGAPAVDLNFGCPAKTVNRHRGGAVLLVEPELLHRIVAEVRQAVPSQVPVTAKMRLGYMDRGFMRENAQAIEAAGAQRLVVHARTKLDGYRPPAHWEALALIRESVRLPLMANGDIFSVEDARRCSEVSGCSDLMLGRGAVRRPDLSGLIRGQGQVLQWGELVPLQLQFMAEVRCSERGAVGRYKQWLGMMSEAYPEAAALFAEVKRMRGLEEVRAALRLSATPAPRLRHPAPR